MGQRVTPVATGTATTFTIKIIIIIETQTINEGRNSCRETFKVGDQPGDALISSDNQIIVSIQDTVICLEDRGDVGDVPCCPNTFHHR